MNISIIAPQNFNILNNDEANKLLRAQVSKGLDRMEVTKVTEAPDSYRLNVSFVSSKDPKNHEKYSQKYDNIDAFVASYNRVNSLQAKLTAMANGTYKQRGRRSAAQIEADKQAQLQNAKDGKNS